MNRPPPSQTLSLGPLRLNFPLGEMPPEEVFATMAQFPTRRNAPRGGLCHDGSISRKEKCPEDPGLSMIANGRKKKFRSELRRPRDFRILFGYYR